MLGAWLREASVLVAVFAWLDKRIRGDRFSGAWAVEASSVVVFLLLCGVALERFRPRP
jgi:hypothetical protein